MSTATQMPCSKDCQAVRDKVASLFQKTIIAVKELAAKLPHSNFQPRSELSLHQCHSWNGGCSGSGRALTGSVRVLSFSKNCTTQYASWKGRGRERQQATSAQKRFYTNLKHQPGENGWVWWKCCAQPPRLTPIMLREVLLWG